MTALVFSIVLRFEITYDVIFCIFSGHVRKEFYLQKNPTLLNVLLGKLFVFAFTWSFGANFKRENDFDEEFMHVKKLHGLQAAVDMTHEFDTFVRELFEIEPPCGKFLFILSLL